ncbi:MAG TPA: replication factor C small subunit [Candidatus Saccharimonadales bacterium]|nr:replication factor C small subunit [Candidatus Saccharimonadales bacterium]
MSELALMWIEKYRPKRLDEVVNQKETVNGIKALLKTPTTLPHLLFSGPPGTGKSTMALCIARELMGENFRRLVLELNASDERGIGVVRERIKGFSQIIQTAPSGVQFGLVILDESDEMTRDAQTALRRIMETSSRTCRFILICNYQSGIIEPIQSRCSIFRFRQLDEPEAIEYLMRICESEKVDADPKTLARIYELSSGDLRKAVNYLQVAATASKGKLGSVDLSQLLPQEESHAIQEMLALAIEGEFIKSRDILYQLMGKRGMSGREIIRTANRELTQMPKLDAAKQAEAVRILGEYDFRLTQGANEDIQLSAMLAQLSLLGSR